MMQPRDTHDDSDCALEMEEEQRGQKTGSHSWPVDASSSPLDASSSSNRRTRGEGELVRISPVMPVSSAASALVGARKRKAIRVVKHQQQSSSPVKTEADDIVNLSTTSGKQTEQGNTSMDTGVSSDLSESRRSHCEEDIEDEEDMDDELMEESEDLDSAGESGGEFYRPRESQQHRRRRLSDGRKRMRMEHQQQHRHHPDDSRQQELPSHPIALKVHKERITIGPEPPLPTAADHQLKCPECSERFPSRANLIHHVQRTHPAALAQIQSQPKLQHKDLADIPSILHLANAVAAATAAATAATSSGRLANHYLPNDGDIDEDDDVLTNPSEEYKNEEDDPFSAVLREMKIKGEFPCRLCEAVFPNLRALKGHNRNHLTHAPYRCNMCPSTSDDKGALIRHMRTHNGERPYECRDCQYAFTTKANCERHLRNRHGKQSRDAVRASIIYHLSEDSAANRGAAGTSIGDDKSSNGLLDLSADGPELMNRSRREEEDDEESTDYPSEDENEQDGPLDLTVDVLDLTKRRSHQQQPPQNQSEPLMLIQHQAARMVAKQSEQPAAKSAGATPFGGTYFGSPYSGPSIAGLPFFYPGLGGTASYSAFFESKLAEMGGNPAVDLSALALAAAHHDAIRQAQQQQQSQPAVEGLLMAVANKKASEQHHQQPSAPAIQPKVEKKSSSSSLEPGVKMVLKNGVLVKKQKQRRYRTERPFGCEHCTARFTLRSNMERHIKQQHPDIWSTRPRGHRRSACALTSPAKSTSSGGLPTMVELKSPIHQQMTAMPVLHHQTPPILAMKEASALSKATANISEQVRHAVQQKLNSKKRRPHHSEDEDEEDDIDEEEEEEDDGTLVIDEPKESPISAQQQQQDLASVSKLLNNAVAQSFQQYFSREEAMAEEKQHRQPASPSEANSDEMDEGECTSVSDGHSGGSDFGGKGSSAGNAGGPKSGKKKSAYSNAPHRVSCPYCSRKFPWTSSLRRHILTHTGQKPYKCAQCPLWFTTKSNCDRHLLRKHGNHAGRSAATSDLQNNSGSNSATDTSRNVPDRPYKCALCPSSTFASSDNLKKHVDNKHCPGHGPVDSPDSLEAEDRPASQTSDGAGGQQEQLPFKCHLCDDSAGFAERQEVLAHLEREHREEFVELVGKGALVTDRPSQQSHHNTSDEGEDYEAARGKFPDYVNRKVMCAFCLRRFWSAEDLRRHMRTHSGERPFQCDVCSRKFTLKHSMLRHRRKHADGAQVADDDSQDDEEECEEDVDEESAEESSSVGTKQQQQKELNAAAAALAAAKVRMQALWSGNKKLRGLQASDLIGNLLGIPDTSIVEQLMSKPADDAARLLGVTGNRV